LVKAYDSVIEKLPGERSVWARSKMRIIIKKKKGRREKRVLKVR